MILESKTVARSFIRRAGLTGVAHRIRMLWHRGDYEDRFADALLGSIRPGDCVWDVGANVGYYTERLSRVASHVIAFEPVPENCSRITSRMLPNVECCQTALGDTAGEVEMFVNGPFSSVAAPSRFPVSRPDSGKDCQDRARRRPHLLVASDSGQDRR